MHQMLFYSLIYFLISIIWLYIFARFGANLRPATLILAFIAGLAAGPLAGLTSNAMESSFLSSAAGSFNIKNFMLYFLIVGPVEEGAKFLTVFLVTFRRQDFKTSTDGIILAVACALGFAGGENTVYLSVYGLQHTLPRLLLGNLGHAAFSVYWGYAYGVVMNENAPPTLIIAGLTLAALFHGAYNYFLTFSYFGAALAFILSGALYGVLFKLIITERRRNNSVGNRRS